MVDRAGDGNLALGQKGPSGQEHREKCDSGAYEPQVVKLGLIFRGSR
jgi:hypothetical protein